MAEPLTQEQTNALGTLSVWLGDYKLAGLTDTIKQWIIDGYDPDRVQREITTTDVFKQEFPEYQAAITAGNPMTPADILNYRTTVTATFRNAGLPEGFYDSRDDFVDLITKRLSPTELQTRVNEGFARVAMAPQEVKDTFNEFFGAQGENLLATFFLDPTKGTEIIDKKIRQAEIGGFGKMYGFEIDAQRAEGYAAMGLGGSQAQQAFAQAHQLKPLAEESISETGDLSTGELAEATLIGGKAQSEVQRRQQERSAAFQGGGGATTTQKGLGLGAANK